MKFSQSNRSKYAFPPIQRSTRKERKNAPTFTWEERYPTSIDDTMQRWVTEMCKSRYDKTIETLTPAQIIAVKSMMDDYSHIWRVLGSTFDKHDAINDVILAHHDECCKFLDKKVVMSLFGEARHEANIGDPKPASNELKNALALIQLKTKGK